MKLRLINILVICYLASVWCLPTPYERAVALVANMTKDEKLSMVHGHPSIEKTYAGHIPAIPRLNIPDLNLEDGPQGVGDLIKQVTCWPSAVTVSATWDIELMYAFAQGTANEERRKGANIHLSPMVNIARVPLSGRTYEGFGEDPYLASRLVEASIKGIQSQGVIATVKHWVNNNQEYERGKVSANVDERTEWEIYYPAFQAAIDVGVGSVMCSYNRVNETHACENEQTIINDLKGRMGFQGFVMSDWFATHSTVESANGGLDMEMPAGLYFGAALTLEVDLKKVSMDRVDDMVTRTLTAMFAAGIFDNPQTGDLAANVTSWNHTNLARQIAATATVLLKNDGSLLPLNPSTLKKIALVGDDASDDPIFHGTGSGSVKYEYIITPLEGIKARVNSSVTYSSSKSITAAAQAAQNADVAIVFASVEAGEGTDRTNLSLSGNYDELIAAVAKVQPNTIVVLHVPGAVVMPWISEVKAVLCAFYPGQEMGNAIADVLFGDVNPSARLPLTFPQSMKDFPLNTTIQYPGIDEITVYTEKLEVGYRWFDANGRVPLFPFGHGLSYTTFNYSSLSVVGNDSIVEVSFKLTNTGKVSGAEIAQLYLSYPAEAGEPPQNLRGFQKITLSPGESAAVKFTLQPRDFSIWDITVHDWKIVPGTYKIGVGASSRDIRNTNEITL